MKLSEAVNKVIDLSRKMYAYYDAEMPKWHRDYPLINPDEEDPPPPPEELELKEFLASLPDEVVFQLILLRDFGRRPFRASDLAAEYETWSGPEHAGFARGVLLNTAPLADDLSDALEKLRKEKISVDKLPLRKIAVRKR